MILGLIFLYKKYFKKLRFKCIRFFYKTVLKILGLATIPDLKVIFIILIITLNLHNPNLNGCGCNTRSNSFGYGSGCKVVS
jgi:hypothetical protein